MFSESEACMNDKLYKMMNWPKIEEIIYSECDDPQELLGPSAAGKSTLVQTYYPGAAGAEIIFETTGKSYPCELADEDGFFACLLPMPPESVPTYSYVYTFADGSQVKRPETYRFAPIITKEDTEKFKYGIHETIYELLGAHPRTVDGIRGTHFAVWAPNALRVSVVGDFNHWDGRIHQMRRLWDSGIFELFVPDAFPGDNYKFELKLKGGMTYLKADPYGNEAQQRPDTASVISNLGGFAWEDAKYLKDRAKASESSPVSICEVDPRVFRTEHGTSGFRAIAKELIPYLKDTGFTHVELMGVLEYPEDASKGYQVTGYYAPTARYGSPKDFMFFVNEMHKAGIGVIIDWVPSGFSCDGIGLSAFDGTCLYEHRDPRQGYHAGLNTATFQYGRPQVSNFLTANALFWIEKYHVDGLRMDAVSNMLYLDYGKQNGEWIPNMYGGNENLEAWDFLRKVNSLIKDRFPGVMTIASEVAAAPMVTADPSEGGLGFTMKWNNGFVSDYLEYIGQDPIYRRFHHNSLTFSMVYQYTENFITAFSHEVLPEGMNSLLERMPGEAAGKLANLRLTLAYQFLHPGKKLVFCGGEESRDQEEVSAADTGLRNLLKRLNELYRTNPALYDLDTLPEGFSWINSMGAKECILSFVRNSRTGSSVLVAANFSGIPIDVTVGVPAAGKFKEILNTDDKAFGGTGVVNVRAKRTKAKECDGFTNSLAIRLAPLSLSVLQYIPLAAPDKE